MRNIDNFFMENKTCAETIPITNDFGLHARVAAKIVALNSKFSSTLTLKKGDRKVDGSSILSILTLSSPKGSNIEVQITGEDCEFFMDELKKLFRNEFE